MRSAIACGLLNSVRLFTKIILLSFVSICTICWIAKDGYGPGLSMCTLKEKQIYHPNGVYVHYVMYITLVRVRLELNISFILALS